MLLWPIILIENIVIDIFLLLLSLLLFIFLLPIILKLLLSHFILINGEKTATKIGSIYIIPQ